MVLSNFPRLSRNLPLVNLFIASTALGFQIMVLYPWHLQIDESHHKLIKEMNKREGTDQTQQQQQQQQQQQALNPMTSNNKFVATSITATNTSVNSEKVNTTVAL